METTPVHRLSFCGVLSESKRIRKANYSHFVALSLFFLPLAFFILITPTIHLSGQFFTGDQFHNFPPILHKPLISHLLCILILYILSISAIATITYSTYHGFFNKQIKFFTSLKSLTTSFFPLLSTSIVIHLLLFCISVSFLLLIGSIVIIAQNLGFVIDHNSIQFTLFSAVFGVTLLAIIIYFQVNWSLAFAIVVVESNWGFRALMRSWYLVKGMRSVSLSLLLYYGGFCSILVLVYTNSAMNNGLPLPMVFTILYSCFLMMFMVMSTSGNTVLYMYCKALHGELAIEIADQFAYINLPSESDDEKVKVPHNHIVTIEAA